MLVNVPLALWALPKRPKPADLHAALAERYAGSRFVRVAPLGEAEGLKELEPPALNGTNMMELFVFADAASGRAVVTSRLDKIRQPSCRDTVCTYGVITVVVLTYKNHK